MGWFGMGGGGNNPLDKVELDKDQLPSEVEKPASAKDIEKAAQGANVAQTMGQFDALANSMATFNKVVTDMKREGAWKEAMEAFSKQEQSRQEEFKAMQKDRELEIERLKKNALSESFQHQKEMKRHEHDLAMKKAQYEDQLRSERKDREIQKDLAKSAREEELRRETIMFEQQESMKNEETKAMIHARAQAQVERENHEYRMEQAKMEAKERSKVEKEVARVRTEELYKFVTTVLQNKDGMLSNGLFFAGGLTVVGITTWQVMKFGFRYAESMLSKPKLVQETSRMTFQTAPRQMWKRIRGNERKQPQYIFNPKVQAKVEDITLVTRNARKYATAYRNVLLHGPPGTGKTLYAKHLAKQSSMKYAIMSGGDVGPMGNEGVTELNNMFDWAGGSKSGVVLFIDEADAFLRPREEKMTTELRSAINTFLARTGEPSEKIQIVLATNQIRQLDSAVLDRMNELVEVPLPQFDEREAIISQYMLSHVIQPANDKTSRVILGEDIIAVLNDPEKRQQMYAHLAEITEGMSGREMEKMCSNISASAVSAEDPTLSLDSIERAANDYKSQSTEKVKIRTSREKAMEEGKSY